MRPSTSVATSVPLIGVSSLPLALPSCATGASFTGLTVKGDGRGVGAPVPSLAVKVKLSVPLKFEVRRVDVGAVGIDHDGRHAPPGGERIGQRRAVDVGRDQRAVDRRILVAAGAAVSAPPAHRSRLDGQGDGRGVAVERAVVCREGELSAAVEVRRRRVGEVARHIHRDGAVLRPPFAPDRV